MIDREKMLMMVKMARDDEYNGLAYMMAGRLPEADNKRLEDINEKWEPIIDLIRTAPEPEEKKYRCEGCGEFFGEDIGGHARAEDDGRGNPVPVQCGPVSEYKPEYSHEKVKRLVEISSNIATQNNRATADPIFIVQQKVRDFGFEPSYADEYIWIDEASEEVGDPELIAKLEASDDEEVDGLAYHKVYYKERMEYVTACFTERGCLDYIEQNRHRMKDPTIYVDSLYRNEEMRLIRAALADIEKEAWK